MYSPPDRTRTRQEHGSPPSPRLPPYAYRAPSMAPPVSSPAHSTAPRQPRPESRNKVHATVGQIKRDIKRGSGLVRPRRASSDISSSDEGKFPSWVQPSADPPSSSGNIRSAPAPPRMMETPRPVKEDRANSKSKKPRVAAKVIPESPPLLRRKMTPRPPSSPNRYGSSPHKSIAETRPDYHVPSSQRILPSPRSRQRPEAAQNGSRTSAGRGSLPGRQHSPDSVESSDDGIDEIPAKLPAKPLQPFSGRVPSMLSAGSRSIKMSSPEKQLQSEQTLANQLRAAHSSEARTPARPWVPINGPKDLRTASHNRFGPGGSNHRPTANRTREVLDYQLKEDTSEDDTSEEATDEEEIKEETTDEEEIEEDEFDKQEINEDESDEEQTEDEEPTSEEETSEEEETTEAKSEDKSDQKNGPFESVPPGFALHPIPTGNGIPAFLKHVKKLRDEGKQLWYFTIPDNAPPRVIQSMTRPVDGSEFSAEDGQTYRFNRDEVKVETKIEIFLPQKEDQSRYRAVAQQPARVLHLTKRKRDTPPAEAPRKKPKGPEKTGSKSLTSASGVAPPTGGARLISESRVPVPQLPYLATVRLPTYPPPKKITPIPPPILGRRT